MTQEIKELYGFEPNNDILDKLFKWEKIFVEYNSHTNLMSKNDIPFLYKKHVLDSLSITLIPEFRPKTTLLDIGAGGGFPSVIISIFKPDINVIALDSTRKKTDFIQHVKEELNLENLSVINARAEDIKPVNADFLVNRAVGTIKKVWGFSKKHLKKDGYFVSYKAQSAEDEAVDAMKEYKELKNVRYFPYKLPLIENYTRKLVVFNCG